ncbi:hypothetical protein LUZ60_004585 [Juncus effusus]|nr:hypothetical protein LUZ60_004585 [Juncus effusus]
MLHVYISLSSSLPLSIFLKVFVEKREIPEKSKLKMNKDQEAAWAEAQNITIGEDLIAATKRQLKFLAAVDRRRWLYNSPGLEHAIYRYKTFWLPLLANHAELQLQAPLVVPLDCEWIWHCHRLNPVQYKRDCERAFGKILDNKNVISSIQTTPENNSEEIWMKLYPTEPFELKFNSSDRIPDINSDESSQITYDLISAAKRQSDFCYQVSRPGMSNDRVLRPALERYKGLLYLIKTNKEKKLSFCVPTYDIDIMWHSHQLSPVSYCNDLINLIGEVLGHDDNDSDRSKGKKLDSGFSKMTEQFEKVFGLRYWRAGVMYRGAVPTALKSIPVLEESYKSFLSLEKFSRSFLSLPPTTVVEVFLEVVEVKDAQINENEILYVSFTKKQQDIFISGDNPLSIFSFTKEKDVASFECEPTGELILTLIAKSPNPTSNSNSKLERVIGTTSISLEELTRPKSNLSMQTWLEVKSKNWIFNSDPVYLHVAISCTVPIRAPVLLNMVKYDEPYFQPFFYSTYGKDNRNIEYGFVDVFGNEAIRLQMRDNVNGLKKEIVGIITDSRKNVLLAEGNENKWLLNQNCNNFSCTAEIKANQDGTYTCELKNDQMVKLYWGKMLEFEEKCCNSHNNEVSFITAVEFSAENPYGKAIALLDMKAKLIKVNKEWFVLPWIALSFIFVNLLDKQSNMIKEPISLTAINEAVKPNIKDKITTSSSLASETAQVLKNTAGGCGGSCGNMITSSVASDTLPVITSSSIASETSAVGCDTGCGGGCRNAIVSHNGTDGTKSVAMPLKTSFGCCACLCVVPSNNKGAKNVM